jgi:SAM-dependent methyltransferase
MASGTDDRWWRGFDDAILDALPANARVLDVGCGDGGLARRLALGGLDAFGVDPRAPAEPRMIQEPVESLGDVGTFDAVCAVMSLHHADLEPVFAALTRLLRPRGQLFVYEFAWAAYDQRAASWLAERDASGADNSVTGWHAEHADLHPASAIRAMITETFDLEIEVERPYLARMLRAHHLEREEQAMIDDCRLPALGRWYVARSLLRSNEAKPRHAPRSV